MIELRRYNFLPTETLCYKCKGSGKGKTYDKVERKRDLAIAKRTGEAPPPINHDACAICGGSGLAPPP